MLYSHVRTPHRRIVFFILVLMVSCEKTEEPILSSSLNAVQSSVRYRDSVFADADTLSLFNVFYRQVTNVWPSVENLAMDAYLPMGDTASGRAAVLFLHGGGFYDDRDGANVLNRKNPSVREVCTDFAKRGYVAISASYRRSWDLNGPPAPVTISDSIQRVYEAVYRATQDIRATLRFIKMNAVFAKIDTNKIFIGGGSAGAITAMSAVFLDQSDLGTSFSHWGPLDGYGQYDYPGYSNKVLGIINYEGALLTDTIVIRAGAPPVFSVYGSLDPFYFSNVHNLDGLPIGIRNGQDIQRRIQSLGINPSVINVIQGVSHGNAINSKDVYVSTAAWMYNLLMHQH